MAVLSTGQITLLDIARNPANKDAGDVIELLAQLNPILEDAPAFECNRGTYHETTVRTGLPTPVWGAMYEGTPATKGTKQMVKDTVGFVTSACEVDCRIVDIYEKAEDKASCRLDEAESHIEALGQEGATAMFYHDSRKNARLPMGLAPRYSSLSAENGKMIVDGGGTGNDNTSVWMVTWDKSSAHLIYPKTHKAGIQRDNQGKQLAFDANNNRFMVYREEFSWHFGLTVRNWQYIARIANIDISDLKIDAATGADLVNLLTEMYYQHKGRRVAKGKTVIYMNTTLVKYLDYQARNVKDRNLFLTYGEYGPNAKEVLMFRGIPIRECDAILNTEERVVA